MHAARTCDLLEFTHAAIASRSRIEGVRGGGDGARGAGREDRGGVQDRDAQGAHAHIGRNRSLSFELVNHARCAHLRPTGIHPR